MTTATQTSQQPGDPQLRVSGADARSGDPCSCGWSFLPLVFVVIVPLVYMVSMAFTTESNQFDLPHRVDPRSDHASQLPARSSPIPLCPLCAGLATACSLPSSAPSIIVFLSSLSGYAFARLEFPGKNLLFSLLLFSLMIPAAITLIPAFLLLRDLKLLNTYFAIWLPAAASVTGIFLMRQHFYSIPSELEDAARVDGAGRFRIYWQICLPLVRGAMVALSIFTFLALWNDLFWPLIVLSERADAHPAGRPGGDPAGQLYSARAGLRRCIYRLGARADLLRLSSSARSSPASRPPVWPGSNWSSYSNNRSSRRRDLRTNRK